MHTYIYIYIYTNCNVALPGYLTICNESLYNWILAILFRQDFVGISWGWALSQRNFHEIPLFFLVQKCCDKTFCHTPEIEKHKHFNEMLVCFATTFCHKANRWNFVEISLGSKPTNSQRILNVNESFNDFLCGKMCGKMDCHTSFWPLLPQTHTCLYRPH